MKAQVHIEWSGEGSHFTGYNPNGIQVAIDGDQLQGSSPMMLLLHAEAGCTGIDVLSILKKMQQQVNALRIEVEAVKTEGDYPRIWESIHLRYLITGKVDAERAQHAIDLSLGKYCSVSAMLHHTAKVTNELVILESHH